MKKLLNLAILLMFLGACENTLADRITKGIKDYQKNNPPNQCTEPVSCPLD